jgi:3-hydroxyacyl-[acyl-carrier-protein] dehydratase
MDIDGIRKLLRHRYPLLLVDRITRLEPHSIEGIKNVTINEPQFVGHFPEYPIMPGVMVIEALAQVSGVLILETTLEVRKHVPLFLGIDRARFRGAVRPGDVLRLTADTQNRKANIWKMACKAYVGDKLVCEAELTVGFNTAIKAL